METDIKISVLMSVYNPQNQHYLLQAVQSIVNQTFQEWEMILYDDGSDEPYVSVIREMSAMDKRIRYIRGEKNMGLAYALNFCCGIAKGIYTARMDADDISKPDRLQRMYEFLESHCEFDWVGCNTELINEEGVWGVRVTPEIPDKKDFLYYSPYIHPSILFRKQALVENGGYKPMKRGEDYELFMRLHASGRRGYNLQDIFFQYREDINTYKHRKYRYQIEEVNIRKNGFRQLGILNIKSCLYVIKPLIVGLIPYGLLIRLKVRVRKEIHVERFKESKV